jgi:hypothetical protein
MTLSKNDYLKKGKKYRRVIEVLGELIFPSCTFKTYDELGPDGIFLRGSAIFQSTIAELEADGWKPCTAQEAGAPKESWRPMDCESYWFAEFDGNVIRSLRTNYIKSHYDNRRLAIGNVHKSPEEAIAWLKSKLDLKV